MDLNKLKQDVFHKGLCSEAEYQCIIDVLGERAPCRMLVYGTGHDSRLWYTLNEAGRTFFIDGQVKWAHLTAEQIPGAEVRHVKFKTKRAQWKKILDKPDKLDNSEVLPRGNWDVIFIDGPAGGNPNRPGRMQVIYMIGKYLEDVKHRVDVLVHDWERPLETAYCSKYIREGDPDRVENRLAHYIFK